MSDIPPLILELRKAWITSGITLGAIGNQMGATDATVSRILSGQRNTSLGKLQRLAHVLGYDLALVPLEDA